MQVYFAYFIIDVLLVYSHCPKSWSKLIYSQVCQCGAVVNADGLCVLVCKKAPATIAQTSSIK